jgi:uncharacterized protein (DUF2062 family)
MMELPARTWPRKLTELRENGDGLMAMEQACDKVACGMALGSPLALMPLGLPAQH